MIIATIILSIYITGLIIKLIKSRKTEVIPTNYSLKERQLK